MALYQKKEEERVFIREVIRLYRELPALWDTTSEVYKNKFEKSRCYDIMLAKYRERYADATKEDLKKKINSLRTNYRKELKKMQDSKLRNGCNYYGDIYVPSLFYFEDINFLHGQEAPSLNDSNNVFYNVTKKEATEVLDQTGASALIFKLKEKASTATFPVDNSYNPQTPHSSNSNSNTHTRRSGSVVEDNNNPNKVVGFYSPQQQLPSQSPIAQPPNQDHHPNDKTISEISNNINHNLLNSIKNSLKAGYSSCSPLPPAKRRREDSNCSSFVEDEDEFYRQAKVWAKDVCKMSPDQQLFAKKAINDIIFEGLMGSLHRNSVKINQDSGQFVGNKVVAGQPEAALFIQDNDDQEEETSSGSMSPPPVSFQTQT